MQKFLFRQAANLVQVFQPKLNILIYHRVMPEPDSLRPWEIDARQFRNHLEWISGVFNVIPLPDAVQQLKTGTLKRRSLAITFDDGYLDNATHALPLLKEFGFHATFFCTSAWLGGGLMWNDQVIEAVRIWPEDTINIDTLKIKSVPVFTIEEKNKAIEIILTKLKYQEHNIRQKIVNKLVSHASELPELMMRPEHIKLLKKQGMEIGGHTHSHPIIAKLDDTTLKSELKKNKQILENILNHKLLLFAYPNGKTGIDYLKNQSRLVNEVGYMAAVSTDWGTSSNYSSLMELKRFTPWDKAPNLFVLRLLSLKTDNQ